MMSGNKKLALGGVLGGLCVIFMYLASFMPVNNFSLYAVSSLFCGIMMIEAGIKWALLFYGATSMLGFFLLPGKIGLMPYILFFGIYGILKYYIELMHNLPLEMIIKCCVFIGSMACLYYLAGSLFSAGIFSKLPLWCIIILGIIIFFVYDYIYSRIMSYYTKVIRKRLS